MNLFNRAIDFAFAMLRLRVLSPEGEGSYVFAITFYLVTEIVTRFGLGTLLTRDVAFQKNRARTYLANVIVLRTILWLLSLPVTVGVLYLFQHSAAPLTNAEVQAIAYFAAALFFANIADALSSVFVAFEKMEYPAATATATTLGKVALERARLAAAAKPGLCRAGGRLRSHEHRPGRLALDPARAQGAPAVRTERLAAAGAGDRDCRRRTGENRGGDRGRRTEPDQRPPEREAAALHDARVGAVDDQPPARHGLLAHQPVGAALGDRADRPRYLLGGHQVHRRVECHSRVLHHCDLPADEPLCPRRQRTRC